MDFERNIDPKEAMELGYKNLDETCEAGDRVWWEDLKQKYYGTVIRWRNGCWVDVKREDGLEMEFEM